MTTAQTKSLTSGARASGAGFCLYPRLGQPTADDLSLDSWAVLLKHVSLDLKKFANEDSCSDVQSISVSTPSERQSDWACFLAISDPTARPKEKSFLDT